MRVSTFWNPQDLSRDCFTFYHGTTLTQGDRIYRTKIFNSLDILHLINYSLDNTINNILF